ncbi:MAG: SEC-C metal-binding domain-containing protein [Casimicrobiaceae bacterium]|nr:SEC-C metal-binding domain-containing protein [Casimicrobiaceae bacterium]
MANSSAMPAPEATRLRELTLLAVDCAQPRLAAQALARSAERLPGAQVRLLTDCPLHEAKRLGIEVIPIAPIRSRSDYSRFMLSELRAYVPTAFALILQWDGWVLDAEAFDPAFWHCDYIGARWPHKRPPYVVGNGGFSWRSKRLLEALARLAPELAPEEAEDEAIGIRLRPTLEADFGIVFAEPHLADRFSFDVGRPVGPTFGFHGLFNFWQVLGEEELIAFAHEAPETVVRLPGFAALTRNLIDLKRARAAEPFVARLAATLGEAAAAPWRERLRAISTTTVQAGAPSTPIRPPASRLAPCPCGSGRRYKECHGALGPSATAAVDPDALALEAVRLHEAGQIAAALERYERVLAHAPEHPVALHFLGVALYQQGAPSTGLEAMWRSLRLVPHEAEWWSNHAAAAWQAGRYELGRQAAERALALDRTHVGAWTNLGLCLRELAEHEASLAAFDQALALAPRSAYARWNRSLTLLALGRYEEGFADYELRLELPQTQPLGPIPACPRWDGTRCGRLLVLAEQGLGDTLMFARFLPAVAEHAETLTLACHAPLVPLLARAFPGIEVIPVGTHEGRPFDRWSALCSLPARLKLTRAQLVSEYAPARYLAADPERVAHWRARLRAAAGARPTVGLIWQGQFAGQDHHLADRSIAPEYVAAWLRRQPEVAWCSLQWGAAPLDVPGLLDWSAELGPFEETAALMSALDLIVTVDTAGAHLAAALGRPTWVLLRHAGEWRYGRAQTEGERTPWYPSMRLFRQGPDRRWQGVLAAVAEKLSLELATQPRERSQP